MTCLDTPLFLLLTGGLLSGWLIPHFSRQWQDRQKALDIKADFVEKVVRSTTLLKNALEYAEVWSRVNERRAGPGGAAQPARRSWTRHLRRGEPRSQC